MEKELESMNDASTFVLDKFKAEGDYTFLAPDELSDIVGVLIATDQKYMEDADVFGEGVYDEDAAYDLLLNALKSKFSKYNMYLMRMVEDYMDFAEEYLASIDAIDWE